MLRYTAVLLAVLISPIAVGCSSSSDDTESGESGASAASLSYIGEGIVHELERAYAQEKGRGWSVSTDATFGSNFVVQTPSASTWGQPNIDVAPQCDPGQAKCDDEFPLLKCASDSECGSTSHCRPVKATVAHRSDSPRSLCVGDGDALLDDVWSAIALAKSSIDVTSLTPPKERFEVAVRNALTYASEAQPPPRARLLFGTYPGSGYTSSAATTSALDTLKRLTSTIPRSSPMEVSVGTYRIGADSWNHSKIIVRDGTYVLEGGTNMWDVHYLRKNPVHDMWIQFEGSAAEAATNYVDGLWSVACGRKRLDGKSSNLDKYDVFQRFSSETACNADFGKPTATPRTGSTPVIAVGRYGAAGANPSDKAIVAMIRQARTSIRLSQQDLGPLKVTGVPTSVWPTDVMTELLRAMDRGVDVSIILSNPRAVPGDVSKVEAVFNTYDNGWTSKQVFQRFVEIAKDQPGLLRQGTNPADLLCSKFRLMRLRQAETETWPDGATLANHVKAIVVDNRAFYLGSQNLYVTDLAEFGFIVDDEKITRSFIANYMDIAEKYSRRTAEELQRAVCR